MPQLAVPVLVVPLVHFFSVIGKARHGICIPMEDRSGLIVLSLLAGRSQFTTNNTGPTESQDSVRTIYYVTVTD